MSGIYKDLISEISFAILGLGQAKAVPLLFWVAVFETIAIISFVMTRIIRKVAAHLPVTIFRVAFFSSAAFIIPLLILFGMLTHPGLYPIEVFDEATHTFTEVPLIQKALLQGHILKMNVFDSFGTPVIGNPVANPFAPHALSYLFLKPHLAMVANKFILAILSFLALFYFYIRRGISFHTSVLTAILTYTAPSFFYFHHQHPHQGVLLYFCLILLLTDLCLSKPKASYYLLLHLAYIIFFLGSGISGLLQGIPFVLFYALISVGPDVKRLVKLCLLPLISALILTHHHLLYFMRIAPLTWRYSFTFDNVNLYTFEQLVQGCAFLTRPTGYHTDYSISYSVAVFVFVLLGLLNYKDKKTSKEFMLTMLLGAVPFIAVYLMLRYRHIQSSIPLIRPVDITRFLWFAGVFIMIPFGRILDSLLQKKVPVKNSRENILLISLILFFVVFRVKFERSLLSILTHVLSPILVLLVYHLLIKYRVHSKILVGAFSALLFGSLLLPRFEVCDKLINYWYFPEEATSYPHKDFLKYMKPYYRLATFESPRSVSPTAGDDQIIAKHRILGSTSRSIISHAALRSYLDKNGLAYHHWFGIVYFIRPLSPETLAALGIRYYVCQRKEDPGSLGWKKLAQTDTVVLYENPLEPSPFYYLYDGQMHFIHDYYFSYDRIEIDLTSRPTAVADNPVLVCTFVAWPGWKAYIDGKPVDISVGEDQFIRILKPDGNKLTLKFSPYSGAYIIGSALTSALFVIACVFFEKNKGYLQAIATRSRLRITAIISGCGKG